MSNCTIKSTPSPTYTNANAVYMESASEESRTQWFTTVYPQLDKAYMLRYHESTHCDLCGSPLRNNKQADVQGNHMRGVVCTECANHIKTISHKKARSICNYYENH